MRDHIDPNALAKLMILVALMIVLMAVSGCGTSGMKNDPQNAAVFMVSRGEVSFVQRLIMGGVDYCKVTQYNLGTTEFIVDMNYDGESCTVEASASDKD